MRKFASIWSLTFMLLLLPNQFEAMKTVLIEYPTMTNVVVGTKSQIPSRGGAAGTSLQANGGKNQIGRVDIANDHPKNVGSLSAKQKGTLPPAAAFPTYFEGTPMENNGFENVKINQENQVFVGFYGNEAENHQFDKEWKEIKTALGKMPAHEQMEMAKLARPIGTAQRVMDKLTALKKEYEEKTLDEENKNENVDLAPFIDEMLAIFDGPFQSNNQTHQPTNFVDKVKKLADFFVYGTEFYQKLIDTKMLRPQQKATFQARKTQMDKINDWLYNEVATIENKKIIFEMLVDPVNSPICSTTH